MALLDDQPVGFLAAFPARLWMRDREITIFYGCDLGVTRRASGYGLGMHLINAQREAPGNLLANALQYSHGNGLIHDRLRYESVEIQQVCLRPYNVRAIARAVAGRNGGGSRLRRVVAMGAPVAQVLAGVARMVRRPGGAPGIAVDRVERPGAEFDRLWESVKGEFDIIPVRHGGWAAWRYADDPITRHDVLLARDGAGQPLGYVAVSGATRRGLAVGRIMDLLASPNRPDVVGALLAGALEVLERRGVDLVSCLGLHPALRRLVGRYLFLSPASLSVPARLQWRGDPDLAPMVYDAAAWHLSYADGDEAFT
jgi:hypothetical protein